MSGLLSMIFSVALADAGKEAGLSKRPSVPPAIFVNIVYGYRMPTEDDFARWLLNEEDLYVREVALRELVRISSDREALILTLTEVAKNDDSERLRSSAIAQLGSIGVPAAKSLIELMGSEDASLRLRVVLAIHRWDIVSHLEFLPMLDRAIDNLEGEPRREAANFAALLRRGIRVFLGVEREEPPEDQEASNQAPGSPVLGSGEEGSIPP